jgi:hypothetical protein
MSLPFYSSVSQPEFDARANAARRKVNVAHGEETEPGRRQDHPRKRGLFAHSHGQHSVRSSRKLIQVVERRQGLK